MTTQQKPTVTLTQRDECSFPGLLPVLFVTRLRFSAAELATLRRACDILEAAETQVIASLIKPDEWLNPETVGLTDLGEEELHRQLHTGNLRQLIEDHGSDGVPVDPP